MIDISRKPPQIVSYLWIVAFASVGCSPEMIGDDDVELDEYEEVESESESEMLNGLSEEEVVAVADASEPLNAETCLTDEICRVDSDCGHTPCDRGRRRCYCEPPRPPCSKWVLEERGTLLCHIDRDNHLLNYTLEAYAADRYRDVGTCNEGIAYRKRKLDEVDCTYTLSERACLDHSAVLRGMPKNDIDKDRCPHPRL